MFLLSIVKADGTNDESRPRGNVLKQSFAFSPGDRESESAGPSTARRNQGFVDSNKTIHNTGM